MVRLGVCVGIWVSKVFDSCSGLRWRPLVALTWEEVEDSWAWGQAGAPAGLLERGSRAEGPR